MTNPGLDPERIKLESAYTEAEAIEEVITAAQALADPPFCVCDNVTPEEVEDDGLPDDCPCCEERWEGYEDVRRALALLETYKGVK